MKTIEEIKDEVAILNQYGSFEDAFKFLIDMTANYQRMQEINDQVARRYAEQAIERCAEVAYSSESGLSVNQESILNVKTELK